jgi:O-antigen/teichoic acid export membrane protein
LLRLLDGQIALKLDAMSAIFGVSPHVKVDADLIGYVASVLGAVTVLVVGSIWRRRKLRGSEHAA